MSTRTVLRTFDALRAAMMTELFALPITSETRQQFIAAWWNACERAGLPRIGNIEGPRIEAADPWWRLTQAKSALENWGRHHPWCAIRYDAEGEEIEMHPCDCGLAAAISVSHPVEETTER